VSVMRGSLSETSSTSAESCGPSGNGIKRPDASSMAQIA